MKLSYQHESNKNVIGKLSCKEIEINFEYGNIYQLNDTLENVYTDSGHLSRYIKRSKGDYPKRYELYLEKTGMEDQGMSIIQKALVLHSDVSDAKDEALIKKIFFTVDFIGE